ncbi:MAG: penicillin-binding protein [Erysipelotrichia bacterium]|nr:penicillin-binding protein [Erysipelotrichia bacterium]NCC54773.1 penicillin-binding protein [Erysipelotrichia bacterium]
MVKRRNRYIQTNKRVIKIMIFFSIIMTLVVSNVLFTMISGEHFRSGKNVLAFNSSDNIVQEIVSANRGSIYDRNKEVIAQDIKAYNLLAIVDENRVNASDEPAHVVDVDKTAEALAPILEVEADKLKKILNDAIKAKQYQTEFTPYGKRLSAQQKEDIEALKLPGLEFVESSDRVYPIGTLASQMIGYAQYDYDEERIKGVMGIEQFYDDELAGSDGKISYQKDSTGYYLPKTKKVLKNAENGNDIYLTIDKNVQLAVEKALSETMETNSAEKAWCVVMEAKTGKVLAQAGYPTFDLNDRSEIKEFTNLPSEFGFEPGSVMKPFVIAGAMEDGVYNGSATFPSHATSMGLDANGNLAYVNEGSNNWLITVNDAEGKDYGTISYDEGLIRSTNTVIANLFINYFNVNRNIEYLKKFGFFDYLNIDGLMETKGLLNTQSVTDKITLGFGQGSQVSAYQLIEAYSALFGDGCTVKPYVIDKIVNPNTGKTTYKGKSQKSEQIISADTAKQVQALLKRVVDEPYGTAHSYQMSDVSMMAKTGTGEIAVDGRYSRSIFTSSIMAAAPAENPEVIVYYAFQSGNIKNYDRSFFKEIVREALLAVSGYENANTNESATVANFNTFTMPSLVNHSTTYAQEKLAPYTSNVVYIGDGSTIISQYPNADTSTISSQKIFLLTDGVNITMPNMSGWTRKDVKLFAKLSNISIETNGSGAVVSQSVAEGTIINNDSKVSVELK